MLKKRLSTFFSILLLLTIFLFPAGAANASDAPCSGYGKLYWGLSFDYLPDVYAMCTDINGDIYYEYVGSLPY